MRKPWLCLLAAALLWLPAGPAQAKDGWMDNYKTAAETAKKEGKYLLLYFTGSDW